MDRFLRALPPSIQEWVSHGDPETRDKLVDLVERYLAAKNLTTSLRDSRTLHPKTRPSPVAGKIVPRGEGGESDKVGKAPNVGPEWPVRPFP